MIETGLADSIDRPALRRAARWLVAAFWLVQFVELSVFAYAQGGAPTLSLLAPRLLILSAGLLLSQAIVEAAIRSVACRFPVRLLRIFGTALAIWLAVVPLNFLFYRLTGEAGWLTGGSATVAYAGLTWSCFFLAMAGALLALTAVHRPRRRPSALRFEPPAAAETSLWVSRRGETVRVDLGNVEHVAAEGAYVRLHLGGVSFLHRATIGSLETALDAARFLRVHRSHVVRVDRIESIRRTAQGGAELMLRDGGRVPVGRTYARAVRRRLMEGTQ